MLKMTRNIRGKGALIKNWKIKKNQSETRDKSRVIKYKHSIDWLGADQKQLKRELVKQKTDMKKSSRTHRAESMENMRVQMTD